MKYDFGSIMKASRVRAGLSQEEMAHRISYNQSDISKFETGAKEPHTSIFLRWVEITNCKEVVVAYLCGMDGIMIMQNLMQSAVQVAGG